MFLYCIDTLLDHVMCHYSMLDLFSFSHSIVNLLVILLAFHATKKVSQWAAATGWDARDPGRKCQFVKPWGEMEVSEYVDFGWNAEDAELYSKAYAECFNSKTMLPYLRIRGAFEYWVALDRNLSEAMIGRMTAKEALDRCARDWKQITNRLGKDEQLKFYRESIGYQP